MKPFNIFDVTVFEANPFAYRLWALAVPKESRCFLIYDGEGSIKPSILVSTPLAPDIQQGLDENLIWTSFGLWSKQKYEGKYGYDTTIKIEKLADLFPDYDFVILRSQDVAKARVK